MTAGMYDDTYEDLKESEDRDIIISAVADSDDVQASVVLTGYRRFGGKKTTFRTSPPAKTEGEALEGLLLMIAEEVRLYCEFEPRLF